MTGYSDVLQILDFEMHILHLFTVTLFTFVQETAANRPNVWRAAV